VVNVTSPIGEKIRHLTDQLRELRRKEAVRLHKEGKSLREIAAELGVSAPTVLADLRAAGITTSSGAAATDASPDPLGEPATDSGTGDAPDEFDPEKFLSTVPRSGGVAPQSISDIWKAIPR